MVAAEHAGVQATVMLRPHLADTALTFFLFLNSGMARALLAKTSAENTDCASWAVRGGMLGEQEAALQSLVDAFAAM